MKFSYGDKEMKVHEYDITLICNNPCGLLL